MPKIISKVLTPAIGLAAEAIAHHREKARSLSGSKSQAPDLSPEGSRTERARGPSDPSGELGGPSHHEERDLSRSRSDGKRRSRTPVDDKEDSSDDAELDEDDWSLDEAAERADPPTYDEMLVGDDIPSLTRLVLKGAKAPTGVKLPLSVIIPQRRPRDKKRGFVRAYAPVLEDTGIDQETFLRFLKAFHQSSQASKYWDVIMISAGIAGFAPSVIAMAVTTAVQIAAGTARELQSRKRTNNFLDDMNQKLFMPRGQIAMIMTFKPDVAPAAMQQGNGAISGILGALGGLITHKELDMNQTIAKYYTDDSVAGMKKSMQGLRLSSGKTHGELAMPEAAPLIYPTLEEVADAVGRGKDESEEATKKKNAFQRSGKFVADYFDRRAQARYASENPDSMLNAPEAPKFKSKLADPAYQRTHMQGGLVNIFSGGVIGGGKQERRGKGMKWGALKEGDPGYQPQGIKRLMQQDVLYLIIVNIPSDEELADAVERMQAYKNQK